MKRVAAPVLSLLLAFSILGAAIGMPLTRHLCQMSQTLTVSVGVAEHLCGQPEQQPCSDGESGLVLKDSCCQFSVTHAKAELQSLLKAEAQLLMSPALIPAQQAVQVIVPAYFIAQKEALPLASDSSPPLAGRSLLAFISILRI